MVDKDTHHRPLYAGIRINTKSPNDSTRNASGTLTGLATRRSDHKKVLVTNLHVMTGAQGGLSPAGNEEMYQIDRNNTEHRVGRMIDKVSMGDGTNIIADVAIAELEPGLVPGVDVKFEPHNPNHDMGRILVGTKDPKVLMPLTVVGAAGGIGPPVVVSEVNRRRSHFVEGRELTHTGVTILGTSNRPIISGDSGAPCLFQEEDLTSYRMSCIVFAAGVSSSEGWAFPASVAESQLGIFFGEPPVADAGQTVDPGDTVILDGSGSSDPKGGALTYSWVQMFGSVHEANRPGARVTLSDNTAPQPTFTAPAGPKTLTFKLTVTDDSRGTDSATVNVTVSAPSETVALSGVPSSPAVGEFHSFTVTADNLDPAHDYMIRVIYNDDKIGPDVNRQGPRNIGTGIFTGRASFTANFGLYGYAAGDAEMTVALRRILNRADDWSQGLLLATDEADFIVAPPSQTVALSGVPSSLAVGEFHSFTVTADNLDPAHDYMIRVIYNDDKIGPDVNRQGPLNIGTGIFTGRASFTANFGVYGYAAGDAEMTVALRRILNRADDWSQGLLLATDGADFTVTPPSPTVALSDVPSSPAVGEFHSFTVTADNLDPAHDYMIRVIYNDDKIGPDVNRRGPPQHRHRDFHRERLVHG